MKLFKYGLALAALCAASSGHATTLRITNNTGLPIKVFANGQEKDITKDPQPVDFNINLTVPMNYVSWSEFNRHGQKMTFYSTLKAQLGGSGDLGELNVQKGGRFMWKGPNDKTFSGPMYAAREGQQRNDLLAQEGQDQLVDFIKSQPKEEEVCWVLGLSLGVMNPAGIESAKNSCMKQTPENQKRLLQAQIAISRAKAQNQEPAPLPADLKLMYQELIVASQKTTMQLPNVLDPKYQKTPQQIGPQKYSMGQGTALDTLLGSSEGPMGEIRQSITQLVLGVVLTIISLGTATPLVVAMAVVDSVMTGLSTGADIAMAALKLQMEQNQGMQP